MNLWFPGHMARARRVVGEHLKLVDVVIEVLDARAPLSSRCPGIGRITGARPRVVVLNKADLADEAATAAWVAWLGRDPGAGVLATVPVAATSGAGMADLVAAVLSPRHGSGGGRGWRSRPGGPPPRAMVLGMPNVGKSAVINALAGRHKAPTGALPGVTRGVHWVRLPRGAEVLDFPGIIWPREVRRPAFWRLCALGLLPEGGWAPDGVAASLLAWLAERDPAALTRRYGPLPIEPGPSATAPALAPAQTTPPSSAGPRGDAPDAGEAGGAAVAGEAAGAAVAGGAAEAADASDVGEGVPPWAAGVLEAIGRARGCLSPGGTVDVERAAKVLLRDLREGRLGRVTLELPGDGDGAARPAGAHP